MSSGACAICGASMTDERLDDVNTLSRCGRCRHVIRDLARCPAGARTQPYGGAAILDRVRLRLVRRRVRRMVRPPGRVFEVGYGTGELLASLYARGYSVAGVDSGQAGLAGVDALPEGALRRGSAAELRLDADEAPYDLVLAIHVLEHVADPIGVLVGMRNMLRPGGRMLVITPDAESLGLAWFGAAWWMLEDPTHVALFSAESLTRALTAAGLGRPDISRPLLESLSCESASLRRRGRTGELRARGVLADKRTLALAATTLPIDVLARLFWPRLRPAILATAYR